MSADENRETRVPIRLYIYVHITKPNYTLPMGTKTKQQDKRSVVFLSDFLRGGK